MKRIAIVTNQMVMGGIEKSLITLLNKLVINDCKVTMSSISPEYARIFPIERTP